MVNPRAIGVASAVTLLNCALLKLDDVSLATCTNQVQCDHLNRATGIAADACTRYVCGAQSHVCELSMRDDDGDGDPPVSCQGQDCDDHDALRVGDRRLSRARETCDGVDNNCDGVIDEGAFRAGEPRVVMSNAGELRTWTSAPRPDGAMAFVSTSAAGAAALARYDGTTYVSAPLRWESRFLNNSSGQIDHPLDVCPVVLSGGAPGVAACNFADGVLGHATGSRWFFLGTNTSGCAAGQLRAGWFEEATRQVVLDLYASPLAGGIDVSPSEPCSGASLDAMALGASRPALASIPQAGASPSRALGLWLSGDAVRSRCGDERKVAALGLWIASRALPSSVRQEGVRGTNDGVPVALGVTRGSGRPAVAALDDGWIAAYGAAGGMRLHVIPAFDVNAPMLVTDEGLDARVPQPSESIDEVAIAVRATSHDTIDLAMVWKVGCAVGGAIMFAPVRLSLTGDREARMGAPVTLATAGLAPSVAYFPEGALVVGSTRGGRAVTPDSDGGWVVSWQTVAGGRGRSVAMRVAEFDDRPVDSPITLGTATGDDQGLRVERAIPSGAAGFQYVIDDREGQQLLGGALVCRRR